MKERWHIHVSLSIADTFPSSPQQIQHPPHEHAFILRRYDTGAISVTTMYKAAFPDASPEEEEREMKWVSPASMTEAKKVARALDVMGSDEYDF